LFPWRCVSISVVKDLPKVSGDEFNVYRALSINPSPYLFFFDYGDFKIFWSSPEAQIIVKNRKAEIHPIAGTFKERVMMKRC
jgi:anthranilate/para-aminobenzoate synthase component I